jgi:uncharacterized membrane protein
VNTGSWFPILLATHIVLAISLFLPAFLLPFTLRLQGRSGRQPGTDAGGRFVGALLWLELHATVVIGAGVAITGLLLLLILGARLLSQPWLLVALVIYGGLLLTAVFVQRPAVRRLLGRPVPSGPEERERWSSRARRQRYVSYLMAAGVGLIGWLMMAKPGA